MIKVIDIHPDTVKAQFLANRTPHTTAAEEENTFRALGSLPGGDLFMGGFSGRSAWERHPSGIEMVQVLAGETAFEIIEHGVLHQFTLRAQQMILVPTGLWHRFITADEGVYLMTSTPVVPQETEINSEDYPVALL